MKLPFGRDKKSTAIQVYSPEYTLEQLDSKLLESKTFTYTRLENTVSGFQWSNLISRFLRLPNTNINYAQKVGNPLTNSAVCAVLFWIMRNFPEAPCREQRRDKYGKFQFEVDSELELFLQRPNPYYDGTVLWMGTVLSYFLDGNAYWLKIRSKPGGPLKELYYVPHHCIEPFFDLSKPDDPFIKHYEYAPGDGTSWEIPLSEIVHFRFGTDPLNTRKGLAPLAAILREIFTDNEATNFSAALLQNMGVPGIILSPAFENSRVTEETAKSVKERFSAATTGDRRGEPIVMNAGFKVFPISLNPQQMDLKLLHRLPEERIAGVFGVPAIIAGLGAGLERSTMANFKEAREMAYESNIIPCQNVFQSQLQHQLLPDFVGKTKGVRIRFDISEVRILQEDENSKFTRYNLGFMSGWIKRAEIRSMAADLPVTPEDDLYLTDIQASNVLKQNEALQNMNVQPKKAGEDVPQNGDSTQDNLNQIQSETQTAKGLQFEYEGLTEEALNYLSTFDSSDLQFARALEIEPLDWKLYSRNTLYSGFTNGVKIYNTRKTSKSLQNSFSEHLINQAAYFKSQIISNLPKTKTLKSYETVIFYLLSKTNKQLMEVAEGKRRITEVEIGDLSYLFLK